MQVVLKLGVADLAGTRFAISPLHETLRALPLLAHPDRSPVNRPWVRWALAELLAADLEIQCSGRGGQQPRHDAQCSVLPALRCPPGPCI